MRSRLAGSLVLVAAVTACEERPAPPAVSLHDAIVMRDAEAVQAHLVAGTDVNAVDANGVTPLIAATTSGQRDVVRSLLAAGADINGRGLEESTALVPAIQSGQPEMALFLLEQDGVDPEARESHGSTPLIEAVAFGQMAVAGGLLEGGADVNAPGPFGRTALHIAAVGLDPAETGWLLDRHADADARAEDGTIPLHAAASVPMALDDYGPVDAEEALGRLIESTSDIDAADGTGRTPLHVAALWADPWIIETLLEAAHPLTMDDPGYSPVCYITAGEHARSRTPAEMLAVVALFREAGLTDATAIDEHGATLATLEAWVRGRP